MVTLSNSDDFNGLWWCGRLQSVIRVHQISLSRICYEICSLRRQLVYSHEHPLLVGVAVATPFELFNFTVNALNWPV